MKISTPKINKLHKTSWYTAFALVLILVSITLNVICIPLERQDVHKNSLRNASAFQDWIRVWKGWLLRKGTAEYLEKNLGLSVEKRTNNKLKPHMMPGPGIKPGTHMWEVSAHTTALAKVVEKQSGWQTSVIDLLWPLVLTKNSQVSKPTVKSYCYLMRIDVAILIFIKCMENVPGLLYL